jgi:phage I-like protein
VKFAYLTNIESIKLNDGETTSWVHAMGIGTYKHPVWGDITFTPERIKQFAANVNNKVRGVDPDIDYDHKQDAAKGNEAAGWVKQAEARSDGLWLLVDWTKTAVTKIKEKAYRYFSPEFDDAWVDSNGVKHENVLFGGALTNRPFLKDLVPVNLSELVGDPPVVPNQPKEGDGMDPKKLRELLGLPENATDDQVEAKLKTLSEPAPTPPTPPTPDPNPAPTPPPTPTPPPAMSVEEALAQLSEVSSNPAIKALTDLVSAQQEELVSLSKKSKEQAVETKLKELDEGKKFSIPPAVKNHLRHIMLNSPQAVADEVYKQYQKTLELGLIDMTEKGWTRRNADQTPHAQFESLVKKLQDENKGMSYADAVERVSAENPKLYDEYRNESFSFKE